MKTQRIFNQALTRVLVQDDYAKLRAIAEKLVAAAEAGEGWAIKEVADRTDGKAIQQTEITGIDGGPVETVTRFKLADLA